MIRRLATLLDRCAAEDGQTLVITSLAMVTVLVIAAYAIDTSIWHVHRKHLQTQADAAALAAAQDFQYPCSSAVETTIDQRVGQYDGSMNSTFSPQYNRQVSVTPTYASSYTSGSHNLLSVINGPDFANQSVPNDPPPVSGETSWGGPCSDAAIDVKLTESNLSSFFPFFSPKYINAQARVSFENLTSLNSGLLPLAEPLTTPNAVTAYLIDESSGATLASANLTSANSTVWSGAAIPITFSGGPVGLEIAEGPTSGATVPCQNSNGDSCYDTTDAKTGITYTRVWSNTGSPGLPLSAPVAPQASDVWLVPQGSSCGSSPAGLGSNFVSSSSGTSLVLCANMTFTGSGGTSLSCTTASATLKVGTTTPAMSCPTGGPNGTWSSAPISIAANSGATAFTLGYSVSAGNLPAGASGGTGKSPTTCTSGKPCTGSFGTVQQVFSGAYDTTTSGTSNTGPIIAASLTDSSGGEIQSVQSSTTQTTVNVSITLLSAFQNSQSIPSTPIELSFGGNQVNGLVSCPGQSAGKPQAEAAIAAGCSQPFQLNTSTASNPCAVTTNPVNCLPENPGNGKLDTVLDGAMDLRIYGTDKNPKCTAFNYWAATNTIPQVLDQTPADPRLLTLVITDYGALSANGRNAVPIRALASFYVTGWEGDPCIGHASGIGSNGLDYTGDDAPGAGDNGGDPSGVLLGHFVQYTVLSSQGTGSGQCVQSTTLGDCIGVLTR